MILLFCLIFHDCRQPKTKGRICRDIGFQNLANAVQVKNLGIYNSVYLLSGSLKIVINYVYYNEYLIQIHFGYSETWATSSITQD